MEWFCKEMPMSKFWGWAAIDEKITINFRDKTYHTTADKNVINKKVLIHKRRLEISCLNPNFWMPESGKY